MAGRRAYLSISSRPLLPPARGEETWRRYGRPNGIAPRRASASCPSAPCASSSRRHIETTFGAASPMSGMRRQRRGHPQATAARRDAATRRPAIPPKRWRPTPAARVCPYRLAREVQQETSAQRKVERHHAHPRCNPDCASCPASKSGASAPSCRSSFRFTGGQRPLPAPSRWRRRSSAAARRLAPAPLGASRAGGADRSTGRASPA